MPRPRNIQAAEARLWLEVLLAHAFGNFHAHKQAQLDLLGIAHDATAYPDDIPEARLAELLLAWSEKHVSAERWRTLQGRVRKRRKAGS